jgi:dipeptide/tripeptide permease
VGFWVLIIVFAILVFLLDKILNKLLGIEKKKISETSARKIDRWGRGIILVIFLCTLPFVITQDTNVIKWYWIVYLILLLGFQSILEWKYLKDSKQHVTTLIFLMLSVIILYNIEYFL